MVTTPESKVSFNNFRDLGGLVCADGKRIKSGKIYRSPVLKPKTDADRLFITEKSLDAILDLRTDIEMIEKRDWVPQGCNYIHIPFFSENDFPHLPVAKNARMKTIFLRGTHVDEPVLEKRKSYQVMPFAREAFNKVFSLMDEGKTFVFHCTEGKDRTGVCAMMIEYAFGCTFSQILEDYLRSNEEKPIHRRSALKLLGVNRKLIDNIYYCEGVHQELLELSIAAMLEKHTDPMSFLQNEYGVNPDRLAKWREFYLE
jgi:protein-tyrosine phosphatase